MNTVPIKSAKENNMLIDCGHGAVRIQRHALASGPAFTITMFTPSYHDEDGHSTPPESAKVFINAEQAEQIVKAFALDNVSIY